MNRYLIFLLVILPVLFGSCRLKDVFAPPAPKIACVGTSITEGYVLPYEQTYPYRLQSLVGSAYKVVGFGAGGCALLRKGDKSYWQSDKYVLALRSNPTIVVIEMGTNDSKPQNWQYKQSFKTDYIDFIKSFQNLPSSPTIYLCVPPPAFNHNFDIDPDILRSEVTPLILEIAKETNAKVIDLYTPLANRSTLFSDGIHPNADGAAALADEVYKAVSVK